MIRTTINGKPFAFDHREVSTYGEPQNLPYSAEGDEGTDKFTEIWLKNNGGVFIIDIPFSLFDSQITNLKMCDAEIEKIRRM